MASQTITLKMPNKTIQDIIDAMTVVDVKVVVTMGNGAKHEMSLDVVKTFPGLAEPIINELSLTFNTPENEVHV
jgi:hypothetical protein